MCLIWLDSAIASHRRDYADVHRKKKNTMQTSSRFRVVKCTERSSRHDPVYRLADPPNAMGNPMPARARWFPCEILRPVNPKEEHKQQLDSGNCAWHGTRSQHLRHWGHELPRKKTVGATDTTELPGWTLIMSERDYHPTPVIWVRDPSLLTEFVFELIGTSLEVMRRRPESS